MCCRFDMVTCSKCSFKGIRESWAKKLDGSLYKLCPGCREMFRIHANTTTGGEMSKNEYMKERYRNDEEYRLKDLARRKVRNSCRVNCPNCNKEMNKGSLYSHINYKSCKGMPIVEQHVHITYPCP